MGKPHLIEINVTFNLMHGNLRDLFISIVKKFFPVKQILKTKRTGNRKQEQEKSEQ